MRRWGRGHRGEAFDRLAVTVGFVERAREALAAAAPRGRSSGLPLAEALAAFDAALGQAEATMPAWDAFVPEIRDRCRRAITEARRRSERLRLGVEPDGYEQLYGTLGDIMDPLDAFDEALARFPRPTR